MLTVVAAFHILFVVILIGLVLVQDSKGGAMGAFGGGSSNSVFGATGGADFLTKSTRVIAIFFAITCLSLTYITSHKEKSVLDRLSPAEKQTTMPAAPAEVAPTETKATEPAKDATQEDNTKKAQ